MITAYCNLLYYTIPCHRRGPARRRRGTGSGRHAVDAHGRPTLFINYVIVVIIVAISMIVVVMITCVYIYIYIYIYTYTYVYICNLAMYNL